MLRQESPGGESSPAGEQFRNCDAPKQAMITSHLRYARTWVQSTRSKVDQLMNGGTSRRRQVAIVTAYLMNFDPVNLSDRPAQPEAQRQMLRRVLTNIIRIRSDLDRIENGLTRAMTYVCTSRCESPVLAEVEGNTVETDDGLVLEIPVVRNEVRICNPQWFRCPNFFKRVTTLIHEIVHSDLTYSGDIYEWSSGYFNMGWGTAQRNADSYAVFIRQVYHGGSRGPGMTCRAET